MVAVSCSRRVAPKVAPAFPPDSGAVISGRFARRQRLLRPGEYRRVFARPRRWHHPLLTVLWRPNGLEWARLGLAVPKRKLKTAVARNRFKRLVRESFRQQYHNLGAIDIVVMPRASIQDVPNPELAAALTAAWEHVSQTCKSS